MRKQDLFNASIKLFIFALLIGVIYFLFRKVLSFSLPPGEISYNLISLPYYTFCSFYRMLFAYILSVIFSYVYGYYAATSLKREKVMLPVLDILQSIPVLGFFPAVVFFFISIFQGGRIGVEIASVVLIFTSQVWNMTFGVYESLTTYPEDLKDLTKTLNISGWQKFKRLIFPLTVPKMVYNSIMSWANGWYFLIACEIITLGPVNYKLPGLGSFLVDTSLTGKIKWTFIGLFVLIILIIILDIFVWKPLIFWAEKFKYEFVGGEFRKRPLGVNFWKSRTIIQITAKIKNVLILLWAATEGTIKFLNELFRWEKLKILFFVFKVVYRLGGVAIIAGLMSGFVLAGLKIYEIFLYPLPSEVKYLPMALLYSFLRLCAAYLISLLWCFPVAIWIGYNKKVSNILTPILEIIASVPATALFPLIVLLMIKIFGSMNLAAVILVLTGMQWYLLFNLMAGIKSIPDDLKEVATSLGLKKWIYFKKIIFPASFPSLITGSITAFGGGWNALIVSEYVVYRSSEYYVFGVGYLLAHATYKLGNVSLILLCVLSMIATISILNRVVWRKLYNIAAKKIK